MLILQIFIIGLLLAVIVVWVLLRLRNIDIWFISYLKQFFFHKKDNFRSIQHIYVCIADHHEPYFGNADKQKAHSRVSKWLTGYREMALQHTDSDGRHPQHSYFYPEEEYDEWVLNGISEICKDGFGDVEIHLHHDNDTAKNLEITLNRFKKLLFKKHGLLRKNSEGEIVYGFIHGNWALDNSRPDGRWCGVDNEIEVLLKTGCVYDMTMPSAPSDTQTKTINSIYLAEETGRRKSHNIGKKYKKGSQRKPDQLLMIQGPLTLNWKSRKFGLIPRIESGELSSDAPPTKSRVNLWEQCKVSIEGAENHIFFKLHTHGLEDMNIEMFFDNNGFHTLFSALEDKYKNDPNYLLHYITAWEMYEKIQEIASAT